MIEANLSVDIKVRRINLKYPLFRSPDCLTDEQRTGDCYSQEAQLVKRESQADYNATIQEFIDKKQGIVKGMTPPPPLKNVLQNKRTAPMQYNQ